MKASQRKAKGGPRPAPAPAQFTIERRVAALHGKYADRCKHVLRIGSVGLESAWKWLQARQKAAAKKRSLRVEESVSLGQKRFVAVVTVDRQRFLVGVGAEISLLSRLTDEASFAEKLNGSLYEVGDSEIRACS